MWMTVEYSAFRGRFMSFQNMLHRPLIQNKLYIFRNLGLKYLIAHFK